MAGIRARAITAEVALTAATARTVLQLVAPANQRVLVTSWGVFFDGTSVTAEPVVVVLEKQTTAGTMSALTPTKLSGGSETLQTTAQHTATAEPTSGDLIDRIEVHPQSGFQDNLPHGREIPVLGGQRLAIKCTAPAGVNVVAKVEFEE